LADVLEPAQRLAERFSRAADLLLHVDLDLFSRQTDLLRCA
jgi:hypothetical protein